MEYSINMNVVEKLIEMETAILENFQEMLIINELDAVVYNSETKNKRLQKLSILVKKENMLLEQLPQNSEVIRYIYDLVFQNRHNFFDDEVVAVPVLNRFGNTMLDLVNLLADKEEEEIFEDENIELDDIDKSSFRIMIRDNLNAKNIWYLEELKKHYDESFALTFTNTQYSIAYAYKNIGDGLLNESFDINKICYKSDEQMAEELDLSMDDYYAIKNDELYNVASELFFVMLGNLLEENDPEINAMIVKDSLRLRFFLHEMDTPILYMFNKLVSDSINDIEDNDGLVEGLCKIVESELGKRQDLPEEEIEEKPLRPSVDEKTVNNLINLLKIEEKIFMVFDEIDFEKVDNHEQIEQLSKLVGIEKEHISNLNITYKTVSVIEEMLIDDMDLFFEYYENEEINERKKALIYDRLHNVIPFFQRLSLSPIQSEKSHFYISQNHIVSTLKLYENVIDATDDLDKKQSLKSFYKDLFFINGALMDDFIFIYGNYKMIDRFSDAISSQIVGISDVEYAFDKDEQLYERAKNIIEEMLSFEDGWEEDLSILALFQFKLSELSDIMMNVSDEHIYALPEVIKENSAYKSPKAKRIIRRIIKK